MDLASERNAAVASAVVVIVQVVRNGAPTFFESKTGQRILPLVPVILGVLAGYLGFCEIPAQTWQNKLMAGLLIGASANAMYKLARTTVMGQGLAEPAAPAASASTPPSAPTGGA